MKTADALSLNRNSMLWTLDWHYWLFVMLPGLLLGIWAQIKLSHAYGKYSQVPVESGMTGAQAAREILDQAGLTNVPVEEIPGRLTDHYDPTKRALFLSSDNFHGQTVAAVGVAAHESGHALQHQAAYGLFQARMALVPVTQFANTAYVGIFLVGMFMGLLKIVLPIIIVDVRSDNAVPARHLAGGIRRQPPGQGTIVPAGPRT